MAQAKNYTPLTHSRAGSEQLFLAFLLFSRRGREPCGKVHSWVLAKLSDLSQELKGILFCFKIFSLCDFLKIRYHKHKTTAKLKQKIKRWVKVNEKEFTG